MRIIFGCKVNQLGINTSIQSNYKVNPSFQNNASINSNDVALVSKESKQHMRNMFNVDKLSSANQQSFTKGVLQIMVRSQINKANSYNGNSFIIATAISVSVLIILLILVIFCARRRRLILKKKREEQLRHAREDLSRNNPQSNINQTLIQNLLSQNPMAMMMRQNPHNSTTEKEEKQYLQDIEKCFPLMTLSQVHEYFKDEVPQMNKEDISKECSICYCDFEEEEEDELSLLESSKIEDKKIPKKNNQQQITNLTTTNIKDKSDLKTTANISSKKKKPTLRLFTFCNHFFHQSCINDWLKKDKSCPHCRQKITQFELNQLKNHIEDKVIQRTKRLIEKMKNKKIPTESSNNITSSSSSITSKNNNNNNNGRQVEINPLNISDADAPCKNQQQQKEGQSQQNIKITNQQQLNIVVEVSLRTDRQNNVDIPKDQIKVTSSKLNKGNSQDISINKQQNDNIQITSSSNNDSFSQHTPKITDSPKKIKSKAQQKNSKSISPIKNRNGEDSSNNSFNRQNSIGQDKINVDGSANHTRTKKSQSVIGIQSISTKSPLNQPFPLNQSFVSERLQESAMEQSIILEEDISKLQIQTVEDYQDGDYNQDTIKNMQFLELIKEDEEEEEKNQNELKGLQQISFNQTNKFRIFNHLGPQKNTDANFSFQNMNSSRSIQSRIDDSVESSQNSFKKEEFQQDNNYSTKTKSSASKQKQYVFELNDLSQNNKNKK